MWSMASVMSMASNVIVRLPEHRKQGKGDGRNSTQAEESLHVFGLLWSKKVAAHQQWWAAVKNYSPSGSSS